MDCQGRSSGRILIHSAYLFFSIWLLGPATALAYQNYTVGDDSGWAFPVVVDYSKWAAGKNFSLGDYLIFNFPQQNESVIVTQNHTMYASCDYEDGGDDYDEYGEAGKDAVSEVPLLKTGKTYFFCGAYSGEHCKAGMKFAINVAKGEGLPPSLLLPPPSPDETPTDSPSTDTFSPPDPSLNSQSLPSTTDNSSAGVHLPSAVLMKITIFILFCMLLVL